jgi:uncharacterized membrane protein
MLRKYRSLWARTHAGVPERNVATFNVNRHRGFYIAIGASVIATLGVAVILPFARDLALEVALCIFFSVYLGMVVPVATRRVTPAYLRRHADDEDPPAPIIFAVMLLTGLLSAVSLFLSIAGANRGAHLRLELSTLAVILGWFAIHTMMAMHYAYEFYGSAAEGTKALRDDGAAGGLDFSGSEAPDGISFLYFSFVVGMTAQTSDTDVSTNAMRRLVTIHGIFSFFYNTVILAAAVNLVVSLAQ